MENSSGIPKGFGARFEQGLSADKILRKNLTLPGISILRITVETEKPQMPYKSFGYYNYIIISRRDKDARSRAWAFVILGDFGSKRRNSDWAQSLTDYDYDFITILATFDSITICSKYSKY